MTLFYGIAFSSDEEVILFLARVVGVVEKELKDINDAVMRETLKRVWAMRPPPKVHISEAGKASKPKPKRADPDFDAMNSEDLRTELLYGCALEIFPSLVHFGDGDFFYGNSFELEYHTPIHLVTAPEKIVKGVDADPNLRFATTKPQVVYLLE